MKIFYLIPFLSFFVCLAQHPENANQSLLDSSTKEIPYEVFENDPTGLRLYTLENGLKVYLSKNNDAPKIETLIAVKAGSTYDPADQTGLAHYLEHMLFKGTTKMGTVNYKKESMLIKQISNLYEAHKKERDTVQKKLIYRKIDSISNIASNYAIANEYDKMLSSIGAEGTNAFTSNEMTVYINKIPSNELDKWLAIEKDRFKELVLRLFHTELETVYEEFNRGQDNDQRKHYTALIEAMFPTHPYGTQTTIGKAEHLKNPSMEAIHNYFEKYYVPNNMALILVGDLDFESTITKVNATFGHYEFKKVSHPKFSKEKPITQPIEKSVYGPSAASIYLGYRTKGIKDDQTIMIELIDYILANSTAGLIDLNLNSQQKVQKAASYTSLKKEYGMHILGGSPRKGQSLDQVKELLLAQIDLIKKGEFDEWLIKAIVNDMKLSQIEKYETIKGVAYDYMYSFVYEQPWEQSLSRLSKMEKITKKQIIDFANDFYADNYVVVKKEVGEDPNQVKVENPKITPITVNRDQVSDFAKKINEIKSPSLALQTIDYTKAIETSTLKSNVKFSAIENNTNNLASLNIKFPIGKDHDPYLGIASSYIDYLGSKTSSNEQIKKEFYKLGVSYGFKVSEDKTIISVSGLQKNIDKGLSFLLEYLQNLKVDSIAYENLVQGIEKQRSNALKEKSSILWRGLMSYGKYGENSRLRNEPKIETLKSYSTEDLISKINSLFKIKPEVFYYGKEVAIMKTKFEKLYPISNFETAPKKLTEYKENETIGKVYFVNYDMVQAELVLLSKETEFDSKKIGISLLFNNYFGTGLSSIVFQEIRESKSLAYSAMCKYAVASEKGKPNYLFSYIGTQSNKLPEALKAMKELLAEMPLNEIQFETAKTSVLKTMAAKRITKQSIYWNYERLKKLGIDYDNKKEIYDQVKSITLSDLNEFFSENIKNSTFDLLLIGNKKDLDFSALKEFGELKELTPEYLFNH